MGAVLGVGGDDRGRGGLLSVDHGAEGDFWLFGHDGGALHGLWPQRLAVGRTDAGPPFARDRGECAGLFLDPDGHWWGHLWRAFDDAVRHAHPPRRGHSLGLWGVDFGAVLDWLFADARAGCAAVVDWRG